MELLKGRVWLLGDDVDTDQILPGYAMSEPMEKLGQFALAGKAQLEFSKSVKPGDIVVAGRNFGCGSSREQAPVALKLAGVGLVIAVSFARIFRRNAINIGLPVLCADIRSRLKQWDRVEVNLKTGRILLPDGEASVPPLSENALSTIEAGGLINRVRAELSTKQ